MASAPTPDRAASSCTGTDACCPGPDAEQHLGQHLGRPAGQHAGPTCQDHQHGEGFGHLDPGRHDHTHESSSCHSSHHA
ncbi:hypothetical protein IL992_38925 [Microbispora sp. NEAU-D428]|uniref:hypothetical protein n=1 Tax=Microbispora sitophila TaxID=2771537 RepID=UPI001865C3DD|nr:hypothetical protein [Microbispora sitophila]MBE3015099.1 hypothetical protein [Microbispora sitophila]